MNFKQFQAIEIKGEHFMYALTEEGKLMVCKMQPVWGRQQVKWEDFETNPSA